MNENEFNDNVNESSGSEQDNQFTDDSIRIHSDMVVTEDEDRMPEAPVFMALYTTLMLLLMTFFIVLVSMGSSSMGKFEKTKQSVRSNFNVLGLGGSKQSLYFLYSILKIKSHVIRDALNLHLPSDQQEISDVADEGGRIYWEDGVSKEEASQLHRFIALGFNIILKDVDESNKYLKITVPHKNVFKKGTDEFNELFYETLKPLLKMIGKEYSKLFIRVYTSDEPLNELGLTNIMELSALRAQTIATLITEIQGVSNEKLMPIGYGSYFYNSDNFKRKIDDFIEFDIYSLWESTVKDINNHEE